MDDELLKSDLRTEFLGCTADEAAWNTTYGSFEDGTARRMELLNSSHRLTTHNAHGLATALTWFSDTIGLDLTLAPTDQVAMTKETLVLIAMLAAVASLMAVMELLLTTPFFSKAVQPLPGEASVKPNGAWWRGAQDGWQSMGLGTAAASGRMGWGLLGRCALLVLCMLAICTCCCFSARRHFCWTSGSSGRSSRPLTQPGSDSSASIFRSLRCSLS